MEPRPKPACRRLSTSQLSPRDLDELWRFYARFVECPRPYFEQSMAATEEVIVWHDRPNGDLLGFEANRIVTIEHGGRRHTAVYTMYADLDPSLRGRNVLQRIGLGLFLRLRLRYPFRPIYWVFTASTYLSYLLLPHNFITFWPNRRAPTPPDIKAILDRIMRTIEKAEWDAEAGVLKRRGFLRYREGVVADNPGTLQDPNIRFYARLNPGQQGGDSLACLCPLDTRNFLCVFARMLRRTLKSSPREPTGSETR